MAGRRMRLDEDFGGAVRETVRVMLAAEAAIFPTETVYGIGVKADDPDAVALLRSLKGRSGGQPFQLLIADLDMAGSLGAVISGGARNLALAFWPGPLTLVVPVRNGGGALGLRLPDSRFIREVSSGLGGAVAASSANPAGLPPPKDASGADVFGDRAALLVDAGPSPLGEPSSVVKDDGDAFVVLREGAISRARIEQAWTGG